MADSAILSVKNPHKPGLVDFVHDSTASKPVNIKTEFDEVPVDSSPAACQNVQDLEVTSKEVKAEGDWLETMMCSTPSVNIDNTLIDLKCEALKSETGVFKNDPSSPRCIDTMEDILLENGEKVDCVPDTNPKMRRKTCKKRKKQGRKIFECDQCGLSFRRKDNFIVHTYIHTGEKPYSCSVCKKGFSRADCLTEHMRIHTGERPYKCDQCDKTFTTSGHRTEHQLIHAGIKPYACSYCDRSFGHSTDLTKHQRIHTGERPYPCSKCAMAFRRVDTLNKHVLRKHEGEGPFTCLHCAKVFNSKGHFERHVRSHCKKKQC